jgi:hypothetical protein
MVPWLPLLSGEERSRAVAALQVVDAAPADLAPALADRYLAMKAGGLL